MSNHRFSTEVETINKFEIFNNNSGNLRLQELPSKSYHKHNNSIWFETSKVPISRQTEHNSSWNSVLQTLEPDTPTITSVKFELPELSRRSERKRYLAPSSFAEKKLPNCFSISEKYSSKRDRSKKLQTIDPISRKVHSEQVSPREKGKSKGSKKISEFKIKMMLQKFTKNEWDNTARFAPIISSNI